MLDPSDPTLPTLVLSPSLPGVCVVQSTFADADNDWPIIPGYELLAVLGEGGMGVVYKARQLGLNRLVALKMIRPEVDSEPELLGRFQAEAAAVARLKHPGIVQIHEIGRVDGRPYLCLEYVAGPTLEEWIDGKPHDPQVVARFGEQLAEALDHAHQQGIVHRDMKPANVLLEASPVHELGVGFVPKITDFGIVRFLEDEVQGFTQRNEVIGTPAYMAPEQAAQGDISPTTDVYALGVLLYEMLTGRPPFVAPTGLGTLHLVQCADPVPPRRLQPGVPRDLETITLKCLAKEPGQRYASARELADDLRRWRAGLPILARPLSPVRKAIRWCRRNPVLAGLATALSVALAALLALALVWARAREADRLKEARMAERRYFEQVRLDQTLEEDVARIEAALNRDAIPAAREALLHAEGILHSQSDGAETWERFDRYRQWVDLASGLETVRARLGRARGNVFDVQGRSEEYAALFRPLGVTPGRELQADWIDPLRESPVRGQLIHALDVWARLRVHGGDNAGSDWLLSLTNRLDTDEWCQEARQEWIDRDVDRLTERASRAQAECHSRYRWRLLGTLLELIGQTEQAQQIYRQALLRYPDDFLIANSLGMLLMHETGPVGWHEALGCFRAALAIRPDSAGVQLNVGVMHWKLKQPIEALAAYQRAGHLQPDYASAFFNQGLMLLRLNRLDEAVSAFRRAITLDPPEPGPLYALIAVQARLGRFEEVRQLVQGIDSSLYRFESASRLLGEFHKRGLDDLAIEVCAHWLRLDPERAEFHYGRGTALMKQSRYSEAVVCLRRAVELRPDDAESLCNLGLALLEIGRLEEAAETLCRGHQLGSDRPNWSYPSGRWMATAYDLVLLDRQRETTATGELLARLDPAGLMRLGRLATLRGEYRLATTAYLRSQEKAAASNPLLAWWTARAALSAGLGLGSDAPPAEQRPAYRNLAFRLAKADLARCELWLAGKDPTIIRRIQSHLKECLDEDAVRVLRRMTTGPDLPTTEASAWRPLFQKAELLCEPPVSPTPRP